VVKLVDTRDLGSRAARCAGPLSPSPPSKEKRSLHLFLILPLLCLLIASCGSSGGKDSPSSYNPGYGPFDQDGNYIEEWADKPAKKRWWGSSKKKDDPKTAVAKKETPKPKVTSKPKVTPKSVASTTPIPKTTYTAPRPVTQPVSIPPKEYRAPTTTTYTPPVSKPKPTVVKVTPNKKAPIRHTIRRGDTLYGLSKRYGASVSAIKKANGLSGNTIITGRSYLIPR